MRATATAPTAPTTRSTTQSKRAITPTRGPIKRILINKRRINKTPTKRIPISKRRVKKTPTKRILINKRRVKKTPIKKTPIKKHPTEQRRSFIRPTKTHRLRQRRVMISKPNRSPGEQTRQRTRVCASFAIFVVSIVASNAQARSEAQARETVALEQPRISVDLGPWDRPQTRQALQLRREDLVFDGPLTQTWRLRVRAIQGAPDTLSAIFSRTSTESYIQEFELDPTRGDPERQLATSLMNWVDAVLANEHQPATVKELEEQRNKEAAAPSDRMKAEEVSSSSSSAISDKTNPDPSSRDKEKKRTVSKRVSVAPPRARPKSAGSWSFISPTRWELGLGLGLDSSLQGKAWLPGWSWLALDAAWTPKGVLRLLARTRWQSHRLDGESVHRLRFDLGPEWMASKGRVSLPFGVSGSVERWWASQLLQAPGALNRIVSLGLTAHLGVAWRIVQTRSNLVFMGLETQLRYSSEIPGWVVPTLSFEPQGPKLFVGGAEWGLLWTLRWGKAAPKRENRARAATK